MELLDYVDDFRIDKNAKIGRGAFADVYKATHTHSGLTAAVKIIDIDRLDPKRSPNNLKHLESEIELSKTLKHENIVQLITVTVRFF